MSLLLNQQELTVEERLKVRVAKSGNACLVKSCDTVMWWTDHFVKDCIMISYSSGAVYLKPVQKFFPSLGTREQLREVCNVVQWVWITAVVILCIMSVWTRQYVSISVYLSFFIIFVKLENCHICCIVHQILVNFVISTWELFLIINILTFLWPS